MLFVDRLDYFSRLSCVHALNTKPLRPETDFLDSVVIVNIKMIHRFENCVHYYFQLEARIARVFQVEQSPSDHIRWVSLLFIGQFCSQDLSLMRNRLSSPTFGSRHAYVEGIEAFYFKKLIWLES